ncbi:helix-turn-helix domain-containing protein [Streptomyces mobaraensis]|uniref:Helix-turn-helix transcriptional regulator n=1 Tax=Streptomyces mobaraensis TaxID=35621 RepID=A0A5N5WHR0_STRMB|nr:AraC family transcriptional regulator [Streptomyces mobaraensis]KAB7852681.1 helix-turn-helix transcriptional regulator [Streptomyces mobaraensis]
MGVRTTAAVVQKADSARLAYGTPHPLLTRHVLGYTGQDFSLPRPRLRRVTALAAVMVVIDFEAPVRHLVTDAAGPAPTGASLLSPVTGLCDRPLTIRQSGREHGMVLLLTPLGARALFGFPLRELAHTTVRLTDLLTPAGRRFAERLAEAPDWAARFRICDEFLLTRIGAGPELPPQVDHVWRRLMGTGATSIGALTDEVGWSRQHLTDRFHREVGLAPKPLARIARLQRVMALMRGTRPPSWAEAAATCGYTDQSHLIREFRLLTGCTPDGFRALTDDWCGVYTGDPRVYAARRSSRGSRGPSPATTTSTGGRGTTGDTGSRVPGPGASGGG